MKTTYIFLTIFLMFTTLTYSQDNKKKTEQAEFKVSGLCGMCKERIENAAMIKGVKFAEWNKESGILKVIYNPEKVKIEDIHKSIAAEGHDTELVKADLSAYKKLPKCCSYRDNTEKH